MDIVKVITEELKVKTWQVEAAVKLIDEGNTIPFISRYRKEATGSLNDEQLRHLQLAQFEARIVFGVDLILVAPGKYGGIRRVYRFDQPPGGDERDRHAQYRTQYRNFPIAYRRLENIAEAEEVEKHAFLILLSGLFGVRRFHFHSPVVFI